MVVPLGPLPTVCRNHRNSRVVYFIYIECIAGLDVQSGPHHRNSTACDLPSHFLTVFEGNYWRCMVVCLMSCVGAAYHWAAKANGGVQVRYYNEGGLYTFFANLRTGSLKPSLVVLPGLRTCMFSLFRVRMPVL